MLVYGRDCVAKARACAEMIFERLRIAGYRVCRFATSNCWAPAKGVPGVIAAAADLREVVLRITVRHADREAVERFTREVAPLATAGPAGLAGYTAARGAVRPVFAYWPTLVPKELVPWQRGSPLGRRVGWHSGSASRLAASRMHMHARRTRSRWSASPMPAAATRATTPTSA